jgi:hypothetical protein
MAAVFGMGDAAFPEAVIIAALVRYILLGGSGTLFKRLVYSND